MHCCWVIFSLQKVDVTSKAVTEVLTRTTEYLQPNPGKRPQPALLCQHPSGAPPIAQGERGHYRAESGESSEMPAYLALGWPLPSGLLGYKHCCLLLEICWPSLCDSHVLPFHEQVEFLLLAELIFGAHVNLNLNFDVTLCNLSRQLPSASWNNAPVQLCFTCSRAASILVMFSLSPENQIDCQIVTHVLWVQDAADGLLTPGCLGTELSPMRWEASMSQSFLEPDCLPVTVQSVSLTPAHQGLTRTTGGLVNFSLDLVGEL